MSVFHPPPVDKYLSLVAGLEIDLDLGLESNQVAGFGINTFDRFGYDYRLTTLAEGKPDGNCRNGDEAKSDVDKPVGHRAERYLYPSIVENLTERLREIYGMKSWIISTQVAVGAVNIHKMLDEWGTRTLVVAANEGTGELPNTEIVYTGSKSDSAVGAIREFFDSVENPSPQVQARVDHFDPDRLARVIAEPYATSAEVVGRATFGVRRPEWWAWEDKMRVDALWEDLMIPHAPYRNVALADAPDAAVELANDLGSVWVADNFQGWHGGGDFVRWVDRPDKIEQVVEWFAGRAERVRITPFLDGLPCSIHGWVTGSGVAVFLPVEILMFRNLESHEFVYAGVATAWEAPADLTEEMRAVALKVGQELDKRVGYRGPFGIDGVATVEGFRPTELNPRMSAGAGVQLGDVDVPLGLLMRAEIEGLIEVDHEWLEGSVLGQKKPHVHLGRMVTAEVRDSFDVAVIDEGAMTIAEADDDSVGKITAGPASTGSFITGSFEVEKMGLGRPLGPLMASALNLASDRWDLGIPHLTAAPDLIR